MDYKTIFLDLDNTLFSFDEMYEKASFEAIKQTFGLERLGIEFPSFYSKFREIADLLYFEYEKGNRTMDSYHDERWKRTFSFFGIKYTNQQMDDLNHFIIAHYLDFVEPYSGAREFLTSLKSKYHLGLITNGPVDMQMSKLVKMGLREYFDDHLVFISEQVGVSKPDPKIFHFALKQAGLEPGEALHIGDSIRHDIAGANGVGMHSGLIHTSPKHGEQVPTYRFRDFSEASHFLCL